MEKVLFFFLFGILVVSEVSSIALGPVVKKRYPRMHLGENVKIEPKGSCPDGWAKFDVNCYIMPNIYLSFDDARGYCENVTTGELVTIYTEDEYNTILSE